MNIIRTSPPSTPARDLLKVGDSRKTMEAAGRHLAFTKGGDAETSYARNSSIQRTIIEEDPLKAQAERGMVLNKGNIYISEESPPSVVQAYTRQFRIDFSSFLRCRSVETVPGGRMVLTIAVRTSLDPIQECSVLIWILLSRVLRDLVQEAYIQEENFNSFNLPFYAPLPLEVEQEIHKEGSFSIDCIKLFDVELKSVQEHAKQSTGVFITNMTRAMVQPLLVRHFGGDIIEVLFSNYNKLVEKEVSISKNKLKTLAVSLVRNS